MTTIAFTFLLSPLPVYLSSFNIISILSFEKLAVLAIFDYKFLFFPLVQKFTLIFF